jgi:hypothetical protein
LQVGWDSADLAQDDSPQDLPGLPAPLNRQHIAEFDLRLHRSQTPQKKQAAEAVYFSHIDCQFSVEQQNENYFL